VSSWFSSLDSKASADGAGGANAEAYVVLASLSRLASMRPLPDTLLSSSKVGAGGGGAGSSLPSSSVAVASLEMPLQGRRAAGSRVDAEEQDALTVQGGGIGDKVKEQGDGREGQSQRRSASKPAKTSQAASVTPDDHIRSGNMEIAQVRDNAQPTLRHDPVASTPLRLSNSTAKAKAALEVKQFPLPALLDAALPSQAACNTSKMQGVAASPAAMEKKTPQTSGGAFASGWGTRVSNGNKGRGSTGDLTRAYLPPPLGDAGFCEGASACTLTETCISKPAGLKWQFKLGSILEHPPSMPPAPSQAVPAPATAASAEPLAPLAPHGRRSDTENGKDREKGKERQKGTWI